MATHDETYSKARRLIEEDLDAFFAAPLVGIKASAPNTASALATESSAGVGADDDGGANLDDMTALQGPSLLDLSTHLRRVKDLVYKFDTSPLAQSPAVLANVFSSRNDLSVALQHDLVSAWATRAQSKVPDCIMKQLYVLTFMAPDSVLAAEASRCSVQIFELRQSTYLPTYAAVAKALDYFGAPAGLLFDASTIAQQSVTPSSIGGSPTPPSSLSSSIVSKWSTLSGWLQFLAAAFNAHDCPLQTAGDDAYAALPQILKSLLLLSADAEIQRNCQFECCGAIHAALRVCVALADKQQQQERFAVLEGVLLSVVGTETTLLSTPALAHMASFLTHNNAIASKFAHLCLSVRFPSNSLPWVGEMRVEEHEVPLEELARVLDVMIEGLEKGKRGANTFSVQLAPKFVALAAFVTLLHNLCTSSGTTWDKKTRLSFGQKCEALKILLEDKLPQKCLVAEVCERLGLAIDILEYHDKSSQTLSFLR